MNKYNMLFITTLLTLFYTLTSFAVKDDDGFDVKIDRWKSYQNKDVVKTTWEKSIYFVTKTHNSKDKKPHEYTIGQTSFDPDITYRGRERNPLYLLNYYPLEDKIEIQVRKNHSRIEDITSALTQKGFEEESFTDFGRKIFKPKNQSISIDRALEIFKETFFPREDIINKFKKETNLNN